MRRLACALYLQLCLCPAAGLVLAGCGDPPAPAHGPGEHAAAEPRSAPLAGLAFVSNAEAEAMIEREAGRSAWAAVRDRGQLLARRGQRGLIHGRVGAGTGDGGGWRRLIDDTEGRGALAVRVRLPADVAARVADDQRVLLVGAWHVAPDGRWLWRAEEVTAVRDARPAELSFEPGLAVGDVPAGDVPADARGPHEPGPPGPVVVTVLGEPVRFGDGWPVAAAGAEGGGEPVAYLRLPGERPVYGGDELLAANERWPLRAGQRYLVESLRVVPPRRAAALPLVRAIAPPRRIVDSR